MAMGGSITVHAWMWSEEGLGLGWSSPKLAVYALVYQISDSGVGFMTANSSEIAAQLGMGADHIRHTLAELKRDGLIRQAGKARIEGKRGRPVPCYVAVKEVAARAIRACAEGLPGETEAPARTVVTPEPDNPDVENPNLNVTEGSINDPNYGPQRSINRNYGPQRSINSIFVTERSINTPTSANADFSTSGPIFVTERSINTPTSANADLSTIPYKYSNNNIYISSLSSKEKRESNNVTVSSELVENLGQRALAAYPDGPDPEALAEALPLIAGLLGEGVRDETILGAIADYSVSLAKRREKEPSMPPIGFAKFFSREWGGGKLCPWLDSRVRAEGRVKRPKPPEPDRLMRASDQSGLWLVRTGGRVLSVDVAPGATREEAEAAWERQRVSRRPGIGGSRGRRL